MRWICVLLIITVSAWAQTHAPPEDAWEKGFAAGTSGDRQGRENDLNRDPRFLPLLRRSFPQRQYFWRDRGVFTPLPKLVQEFIGVPGDVTVSEDRYVTVTGCVPHSCSARGLVWIDTAAARPTVFFVANSNVSTKPSEDGAWIHLWIFSSTTSNWQNLPPAFLKSMGQWWKTTTMQWEKYSKEKVVIVTMVQPNGELVDLSPAVLGL